VIELVFPSNTTLAVAKKGTGNMEDDDQEEEGDEDEENEENENGGCAQAVGQQPETSEPTHDSRLALELGVLRHYLTSTSQSARVGMM